MEIHLRITGVACHMGSHNVRCHPTQANALNHNWYSIYLPRRDGRLSLPRCPDYAQTGNRTHDRYMSEVRRPNRCTTKTRVTIVEPKSAQDKRHHKKAEAVVGSVST